MKILRVLKFALGKSLISLGVLMASATLLIGPCAFSEDHDLIIESFIVSAFFIAAGIALKMVK